MLGFNQKSFRLRRGGNLFGLIGNGFFVLFGCFSVASAADSSLHSESEPVRELTYHFEHTLTRENPKDDIELRIVLPESEPGKQKILSVSFDPRPTRYIRKPGSSVAVWMWRSSKPVKVTAEVRAEIYGHSFGVVQESARARGPWLSSSDKKLYLAAERWQEVSDPAIIAEASSIPDGSSSKETTMNVLHHVQEKLKISGWNHGDMGAKQALRKQKGDCTEFSDLMVALCRSKGIPARSRLCFISDASDTPSHAIVEVYLPKHGWVTFDPIWTKSTKADPSALPNRYLLLNVQRNDENMWNFFNTKAYWTKNAKGKIKDFKTRAVISEKGEGGEWIPKEFIF